MHTESLGRSQVFVPLAVSVSCYLTAAGLRPFEKPQVTEGLINGGFFVFERAFVDQYLEEREDLVLEESAAQTTFRDRRADGLAARWLLAAHGYLSRVETARGTLEPREGAVEGVGLSELVPEMAGERTLGLTMVTGVTGGSDAISIRSRVDAMRICARGALTTTKGSKGSAGTGTRGRGLTSLILKPPLA